MPQKPMLAVVAVLTALVAFATRPLPGQDVIGDPTDVRQDDVSDEQEFHRDDHHFDEEFEDEPISEDQLQVVAWIGVETGPLDPAVAAQVDIESGQGLMIYDVIETSPAADSGLRQFDILLSVDGSPLTDFGILRRHVEDARGQTLQMEVLRKGTRQTMSLTVGQRPWIPDVFMPGHIDIPEDVEINISRHGSQPIKVTVRQGSQTWQAATERELEELPEKVVMWLFEMISDFVPFDEEEEWREERGFDEHDELRFEEHHRDRFFEDDMECDGSDERFEQLESKLDQLLEQMAHRK